MRWFDLNRYSIAACGSLFAALPSDVTPPGSSHVSQVPGPGTTDGYAGLAQSGRWLWLRELDLSLKCLRWVQVQGKTSFPRD
jgi:hypothetical protein